MAVKAKMRCHYVQPVTDNRGELLSETAHLHAVYSSDPAHENYTWAKQTPGGQLTMTINNPAAFGQFQQGKEYLLTFEPVG